MYSRVFNNKEEARAGIVLACVWTLACVWMLACSSVCVRVNVRVHVHVCRGARGQLLVSFPQEPATFILDTGSLLGLFC